MIEDFLKIQNIKKFLEEDLGENIIIIRKYDAFLRYVYPIMLKIPNEHKYLKDSLISNIFETIDLINKALKTDQISKLYEIDANLSSIRYKIKFLSSEKIRSVSTEQLKISNILLSEVGSILNSWITSKRSRS
jgi:hypothetical protein